jgi:hypothetical protein
LRPWLDVDNGIDSERVGTLDVDDGGLLNIGNDGGFVNQCLERRGPATKAFNPLIDPPGRAR